MELEGKLVKELPRCLRSFSGFSKTETWTLEPGFVEREEVGVAVERGGLKGEREGCQVQRVSSKR